MGKIIGIDISKQTFDVAFLENGKWQHFEMPNQVQGFKKLLKLTHAADWVVMEASGSYYLPLADFLHAHDVPVSVVNPLVIKRFSQTLLNRAKTDKKDAMTIAEYGRRFDLKPWHPESPNAMKLRQLLTRISLLDKQIQQNGKQLEAFESSGVLDNELKKEIKKSTRQLQAAKDKLDLQMKIVAEEEYGESIERLTTIPGIGLKTAIVLSVITGNFEKFETSKQLTAYVGFSPRIYQSGTSVHGRSHICKMGQSRIRQMLYICSWSAKRYNEECKEMYQRLREAGKPERVVKIAIANKLLRQAFAIGKNKTKYLKNYC